MTPSAKRLALAVVTVAALAGALLPATAAHAGTYTCAGGSRLLMSDLVGYIIIGNGCTGAGSGAGSVTITSGGYAGTYGCDQVTLTPSIGLLSGLGC
ncbi:hypothetical protein [Streptosporangium sp. KLBMP 9127]|nr:hypothetical protein [Streptosporangium sp. KLBMP 9127]